MVQANSDLRWTDGARLHDVVRRAAATTADAPAVIFGDVTTSFAELANRIDRATEVVLRSSALGDRVAMVGENHPVWIEAYYAVPRAGRLLVFLNHRLAPGELRSILDRSGASVLVGANHELERIRDRAELGGVSSVLDLEAWDVGIANADPAALVPVEIRPEDPAWIIYTSGTTGRSKGAVLTHANVLGAVRSTNSRRVIADDDVYLLPFPLCHIAGYNVIHHHARQRPVVLMPRFDAREFVENVRTHAVTATSLAATMLHSLIELLDARPDLVDHLASLRLIAYGAAPMPVPLLQRAHDTFGVDFTQGYGMTELAGNAVFLDVAAHRRGLAGDAALLATAGMPGDGVALRVVDDDDHDVAAGESGEILVSGGQVMSGYWDEPEATDEALAGGWLHTGDIGRFDPAGNLAIVDRKKDVIVTGGENVSSLEVEQVIAGVPGVGEVAVVGVPDPHWGENVCAVIVPRAGMLVDPDAVIRAVRGELAGFKAPRHVVMVDELPKNATGKIVKQELRAWLIAEPDRLGVRG